MIERAESKASGVYLLSEGMALESPTRSWEKEEREMREERGARPAATDLDLNQAVAKDEGEEDRNDYDYQQCRGCGGREGGETDGDVNKHEQPASMHMRTKLNRSSRSSGSPKQNASSSLETQESSFLHKDQTGPIKNGSSDSPKKTHSMRSRSLTPLKESSPAISPLPGSVSPTGHQLPSLAKPNSPSPARRSSPSPSPARRRSPSPSPPARRRSPSPSPPARRRSPFPTKYMSGSHGRHRSISPRKYISPSPPPTRDIPPSPGKHRSPTPKRRSTAYRDVSPPPKRRRYSPQEVQRKHDRSRSPVGRHGVSSGYGRVSRGRSRSRSPMQDYYRKSPRARISPRGRYSPRRRSPPRYRPQRRSPRRRPWSPPPNRNTGIGKPGNNLFIAGFSFDTTERDLERKFSRFGRVTDVRIVRDKRSGDSRGFGFLTLERDEDADAAIRALDQTEWNGRIVLIEKAKTPTRY